MRGSSEYSVMRMCLIAWPSGEQKGEQSSSEKFSTATKIASLKTPLQEREYVRELILKIGSGGRTRASEKIPKFFLHREWLVL